ncbi:MAG TPA: hypothetical protein VMD02_02460 [Candidatus Omnitrophota bacterium]|nr:hypothetical protein [Candidatus Omnitrophota bacterium]
MYLLFALFLLGACGIVSQVLLTRELMTVFYGNELVFGFVLMFWFVIYAFGSAIIGRLADRSRDPSLIHISQLLVMLLLPFEICFVRTIKPLFGIQPGIAPDINSMFTMVPLVLFPLALTLGFQFALLSRAFADALPAKTERQIGFAYSFEASGWVVAGFLLSFLMLPLFNAFTLVSILAWALAASLIFYQKGWVRYAALAIALMITIASPFLDQSSALAQFPGFTLLKQADSPYGRVQVVSDRGAVSFYENGGLLFSTADRLGNEELVHLSFLLHWNPQKVLLIGGGMGGALAEAAKYPRVQIDYLESDPRVVSLAGKYIGPPPAAGRVSVIPCDGIGYLRSSGKKYDLIICKLPDPDSLLLNRYYTAEFFRSCLDHLAPEGILCSKLTTSDTYLGPELKRLNQAVLLTLKQVFPKVMVVPGNYNYYYASRATIISDRGALAGRWRERKIQTQYFRTDTIRYLLSPERLDFMAGSVRPGPDTRTNSDLFPACYLLGILLWGSRFGADYNFLLGLRPLPLFASLLALILILKPLAIRSKRLRPPLIVLFLSFFGMAGSILIINAFQALYGYAYQAVAVITALYMTGLASGSLAVNLNFDRIHRPKVLLRVMVTALFAVLAVFALFIGHIYLPLFSFLFALPLGTAFPLAVRMKEGQNTGPGALAGLLYGMDLLGGGLAALLVTVIAIPLFGITGTEWLMILALGGALLFI